MFYTMSGDFGFCKEIRSYDEDERDDPATAGVVNALRTKTKISTHQKYLFIDYCPAGFTRK